jgi:hypothetical protein
MSFWSGIARGLEAGEAKRERETAREERLASEAKSEQRWQLQWENTLAQQEDSRRRADRAETLSAEALKIQRMVTLGNAMNGPVGSSTSRRSGSGVPSSQDMLNSRNALLTVLGGSDGVSDLPDDQKEFYTAVLADGAASSQAEAFAKANNLNLNEIHTYMQIGAVVEAQGDEGMRNLRNNIADNSIDLSDAESFMKSWRAAKAYVPGFTRLVQTSKVRDLGDDKAEYERVVSNLHAYLSQDLASLKPGEDSSTLIQLGEHLKGNNESKKSAAFTKLFNTYQNSITFDKKNPYFAPFLGAGEVEERLTGSTASSLIDLADNAKSARKSVIRNFNTKQEAEDFFDNGNHVNSFTVGNSPEVYYPNPKKSEIPLGEPTASTTPTGTAATVDVFKDRDGNIASYGALFRGMQNLPEDERAAYAKQFIALENDPALADFVPIAKSFSDDAVGKVYGGAMWALGAYTAGVAKVGNFFTSDTARAARVALNANQQKTKAKEIMAEGIVEHLQELANKNNVSGSFGPGRAEAIKKGLLESNTLDTPVEEALGLSSPAQNPMGYADSPRLSEALSRVPSEVQQAAASILASGNQRDIEQANKELAQEFGQEAADALLRQKDTNRRIAEEDMAMSRPVPQPLDTIAFNGPTSEDRLMGMPVKQAGGFAEVMQNLATASDEEKDAILSKYIGEDGLPINKPDYAGDRLTDTNKRISDEDAAMAVDFPQPLKSLVLKARSSGKEKFQPSTMSATELNTPVIQKALSIVSTAVGPEVAAVLSTGFQPATMGATELNTPAIQQALTVVEEMVGPEVAAIIAVGFKPATMGATELNTPAVREAMANVPAEVKEAIEAVITQGTEAEVEQAKQEVATEFGKEVAAILFDDLKSARGTGKSAMMSGLQ